MSDRDLIVLGTSSQQPTRKRNHGAYLFRWNEEGHLFDPGEGTQRQFIFARIAPTCVNRIFISHFHGDHCLGVGSMLMRLNLDKVTHPIHCYYPASGKKYFDRLRYGTMYHETIKVVEHPIDREGVVEEGPTFKIEARYLQHGVDNLAYRVTEPDRIKFEPQKLAERGIVGPMVKELEEKKELLVGGKKVRLEEVSYIKTGESVAVVLDTTFCQAAIDIAHRARILLCESTYLEEHKDLAREHLHLTARQAAMIAKKAEAQELILTHFSARYLHVAPFAEEARAIFPNTFAAEDCKVFSFR